MDKHVFKCRVIFEPERIILVIDSNRTYLNAKLICSFIIDNVSVFSYQTEQFDLFEGEQLFAIHHGFSRLVFRGIRINIELIDQIGEWIDSFCTILQDELGRNSQHLIEAKSGMSRLTEGGIVTIELAGVAYKIYAHYNEVLQKLKSYVTMQEPVCDICVDEEEILKEKEIADKTLKYPPTKSEIEMYAIRKMIAESILDCNCFQIHGAAFAVDDCGYIFTADSGVGKTTHMRLWLKNLENVYVVNGDQPLVKVGKDIMVCGSPWCGKEGWNNNVVVPLKAIVVMERGVKNSIVEISMNEALAELLRQVYKPSNSEKMGKTLQLLSLLEGRTKFYRFIFNNFAEDAFSVSYSKVHLGQ